LACQIVFHGVAGMCAVEFPVKPGGRPAGTSNCDALRYNSARYRCPECGHDVYVAFPCKAGACAPAVTPSARP